MKALAWVRLVPIFLFDAVTSYVSCVAAEVRRAVRS